MKTYGKDYVVLVVELLRLLAILFICGIAVQAEQTTGITLNPNALIERNFINLDKHGDGKLTVDEWPLPVQFKMADTNHDGYVTLEEYIAFQVQMRSADYANAVHFQEMDKAGDGKLTAEEFQPASQFALADANNDGVVTMEEYTAYIARIAQQAASRDAGLLANFNKLDIKGDGKLTPTEWAQPARFKAADTNGDGVVTAAEYIAFQKKMRNPDALAGIQFDELDLRGDGKLTPTEWPQTIRFQLADANNDGVVTREEFLAFQKKLRTPDFRIIVQFKELDKKGDGKLTPQELGNAALFAKIDADQDGVVTFDEYKAYMTKRK